MSCKNDKAAIQEGKFSASQHLEIAQNREGISESAPPLSPPLFLRGGSGMGLLGVPRAPKPSDKGAEGSTSGPSPQEAGRGAESVGTSPSPERSAIMRAVKSRDTKP